MKTDEQKKILSKFVILCWAAFITILGRMQPTGRGLDSLWAVSVCPPKDIYETNLQQSKTRNMSSTEADKFLYIHK